MVIIHGGYRTDWQTTAGIVYPIMLRRLFLSIGFPWAVRSLAFLMLACLVICCAIMRLRPRARRLTALIEFKHFHDLSYMAFVAGKPVCFLFPFEFYRIQLIKPQIAFTLMISSVYVPFFYIQKYAIQLNVNDDMAFYLLSMMNASSLIGRLGPNWLAD